MLVPHFTLFQTVLLTGSHVIGGGQGFTGPTICVSGFFCEAFNPFFSQCMPLVRSFLCTRSVFVTLLNSHIARDYGKAYYASPAFYGGFVPGFGSHSTCYQRL